MNIKHTLSLLALSLTLTACGGSSSSSKDDEVVEPTPVTPEPVAPVVTKHGPFSTGSTSEPVYAYFDLDAGAVLTLTEDEAKDNTDWDIAVRRTGVYLNTNENNPVTMYFTGNNADFYNDAGDAVAGMFLNATEDTELEDYEAVTYENIPADEAMFKGDSTNFILDGWYNYDSTTHQVSAADDKYFIVSSSDTYTKFRVTNLAQTGFLMTNLTLSYGHQSAVDVEFSTEQALELDLAMLCASTDKVYIDFASAMEVTAQDTYDLMIPCVDGGADFDMSLHADATAIQDFGNEYSAIDPAAARYYGFQSNEYSTKAFDDVKWYAYNLEGGHKLWSQYGVYIIKNASGYFKFQVTSYYDEDGNSGAYSFRADPLVQE